MAESTTYRLEFPPDQAFPTLSVVTKKTYRAKGPLTFYTDFDGKAKWEMVFDGEIGRGPTCESVEEMLRVDWIEEIDE